LATSMLKRRGMSVKLTNQIVKSKELTLNRQ
jgi:hypothetical protein